MTLLSVAALNCAAAVTPTSMWPHSCLFENIRVYNINGKEMAVVDVQDRSTAGTPTVKLGFDVSTISGGLMYASIVKRLGLVGTAFWPNVTGPDNSVDVYDYTTDGKLSVINVPILVELSLY
jgi:hypothetical protein